MPTTDDVGPFGVTSEVTPYAYDKALSGLPLFPRHFKDLTITSPSREKVQPGDKSPQDVSIHFTRLDIRVTALIRPRLDLEELLRGSPGEVSQTRHIGHQQDISSSWISSIYASITVPWGRHP